MALPSGAAGTQPPRRRLLIAVGLTAGMVGFVLCLVGIGMLIWVRSADKPTEIEPVPRVVIYEDSFGDPESGWSVYSEDNTWAGYQDGEYRLDVYRDNLVTWGDLETDDSFDDFEIEVTARQIKGSLDNNLGLLVRYQPGGENFYFFQISSDGYYSVDMLQEDEWVGLMGWEESDAINQGLGTTNRLRVVCSGSLFEFYVNDTYLTSVADDTYGSGSIGLAVGTFDDAGVVVHFDDLKVYALQE
jgi:hypothetical protein